MLESLSHSVRDNRTHRSDPGSDKKMKGMKDDGRPSAIVAAKCDRSGASHCQAARIPNQLLSSTIMIILEMTMMTMVMVIMMIWLWQWWIFSIGDSIGESPTSIMMLHPNWMYLTNVSRTSCMTREVSGTWPSFHLPSTAAPWPPPYPRLYSSYPWLCCHGR